MTTGGAAFTTTHRVIMRVHDNTAVVGTAAKVTGASGLSVRFKIMIRVGHDAHGGAAGYGNHAGLTRREAQDCVVAFAGGELCIGAGGTGHCSTLAGTKLDSVNERTHGDVCKGQAVAQVRGGGGAVLHGLADGQSVRGDDVALAAVLVFDEGDAGAAVRIVFDGEYGCLLAVAVAEEVDETIHPLVAAAAVTHCHLAGIVAAASGLKGFEELFVGLLCGDFLK